MCHPYIESATALSDIIFVVCLFYYLLLQFPVDFVEWRKCNIPHNCTHTFCTDTGAKCVIAAH